MLWLMFLISPLKMQNPAKYFWWREGLEEKKVKMKFVST